MATATGFGAACKCGNGLGFIPWIALPAVSAARTASRVYDYATGRSAESIPPVDASQPGPDRGLPVPAGGSPTPYPLPGGPAGNVYPEPAPEFQIDPLPGPAQPAGSPVLAIGVGVAGLAVLAGVAYYAGRK
jgi:hypothetical protein